MKKVQIVVLISLCLLVFSGISQNAPVTKIGSNTSASPGTITLPVTVSNFVSIGSLALTLDFDPAVLSFSGSTQHPALSGMTVTQSSPGRLLFSWFAITGGITLPDLSTIADLSFTYTSGTSSLTWFDDGSSCEYAPYGSGVPLNDLPTSTYYTNGIVTNHPAPVTTAPTITNVSTSTVTVPITVTDFNDIGRFTLTFEYDPYVLSLQSYTPNVAFTSGFTVSDQASVGERRKIVIQYTGAPVSSLADGSSLVDIVFGYSDLAGANFSELKWLDNGASCEYADATNTVLPDSPTSDYYENGLIASMISPSTFLPVITTAVPGSVTVPVTVKNFTNIKVLSLMFEYDPAVITYASQNPNSVFGGGLIVFTQNLPNGHKKLIISWMGSSPVSIPDNGSITALQFTYSSGFTALTWLDNGGSCEYADVHDNPLYDLPTEDFYQNGVIASQVAPRTKAEYVSAGSTGITVSVPVNVWNFNSIGSFALTIDYDPGVLTFLNVSPNTQIASTLTVSDNLGRIQLGWFYVGAPGTALTLTDSTELLSLNFTYHGGTSPVNFIDNGSTCEYTEGISGAILYDVPTSDHYINGQVSPLRRLNTKVFIEGLYNNAIHAMNHTHNAMNGNQFPGTVVDQISIELHDASDYGTVYHTSLQVDLNENGSATAYVPVSLSGTYFITLKSRNTLETTSAAPVSFSGSIITYYFDLASKAYGSNMKLMMDGAVALYSGDITNDGFIDTWDMTFVDNDSEFFVTGYVDTDLNGDGFVDTADFSILDNNSTSFVESILP